MSGRPTDGGVFNPTINSLPTDHTSPITQNGEQSATIYLGAPIFSNIHLGDPINMYYKLGSQINRGRLTDHGLSADRQWLWRSPSDPTNHGRSAIRNTGGTYFLILCCTPQSPFPSRQTTFQEMCLELEPPQLIMGGTLANLIGMRFAHISVVSPDAGRGCTLEASFIFRPGGTTTKNALGRLG